MGDEITRTTSIEAYRLIRDRGLLSRARLEVLEVLASCGPSTGAEIDERLREGGGRGHGHKRLPELRRLGVVREAGTRECSVSGHRSIVWEATGRLPEEPDPVTSVKRREPEQMGLTLIPGARR